jgi:hypothetical protein
MPIRKPQFEQILVIEQIHKRDNLAQHIFNWCGENGYAHFIKHIRVTLDNTIESETCVVFIYLFDDSVSFQIQRAIVIVEANLLVCVQRPNKVYWSNNSKNGLPDTVTCTITNRGPIYSITEILRFYPRVIEALPAPQVIVEPPAQPIDPIGQPVELLDQPINPVTQPGLQIQVDTTISNQIDQTVESEAKTITIAQHATACNHEASFDEKSKKPYLYFFKKSLYDRIESKAWLTRETKDELRLKIRESSDEEKDLFIKLDNKLKNLYRKYRLNEICKRISRFESMKENEKCIFKNLIENLADSEDHVDLIEQKINKILERISFSLDTDFYFKNLKLVYENM